MSLSPEAANQSIFIAALFLQGTLVTTDEKLKEQLDAWLRRKQLTLSIKSAREAIVFLSASD